MGTFSSRSVDKLAWSSNGKFFVIYSKSGDLEFFFVKKKSKGKGCVVDNIGQDSAEMITNLTYDPSGRFIMGYTR